MSALDGAVPALRENVDLTKLALSMEEAFVASRVDGRTSVKQIATLVGKGTGETTRIIKKLADLGAVTLKGNGVTSQPPPKKPSEPAPPDRSPSGTEKGVGGTTGEYDFGSFIFSPALMHEPGDLDEEARKRIIFVHTHLSTWNHYELLRIERRAEPREIKAAYFDCSKMWHPDRLRRLNELGSFKRMIDEIYRRINEAFKLLSDGVRRKEYDATLPYEPDPDEIAALLQEQIQAERDARREEEKKAKRTKNNPVLQRFARAKELFEQAQEAEKAGKVAEAMRLAQMATTYDERKPEYKVLFDRVRDLAGDERVGPYLKRGKHFESMTQWDEALEMFTEAVRIAPNNAEARRHLAYTLLSKRRPLEEVMPHAQKAVAMTPDDPEAHYVLGWAYEVSQNEKLSKKHYERALELRPGYQEAKKRLKRLKWGF